MSVTIPVFVVLIPLLIVLALHFDYAQGSIPVNAPHWIKGGVAGAPPQPAKKSRAPRGVAFFIINVQSAEITIRAGGKLRTAVTA